MTIIATPSKKITRSTLISAAKRHALVARCEYRYTDDYAYDSATNFGVDDSFMTVLLNADQAMAVPGCVYLTDWHFRGDGGRCYRGSGGTLHLVVHQNLSYEVQILDGESWAINAGIAFAGTLGPWLRNLAVESIGYDRLVRLTGYDLVAETVRFIDDNRTLIDAMVGDECDRIRLPRSEEDAVKMGLTIALRRMLSDLI